MNASSVSIDLCSNTNLIVVGRISEQTPRWHRFDGNEEIRTLTVVEVERLVRGPPLTQVAFEVSGGELDGVGARVGRELRGTVGSRYLLFLHVHSSAPTPLRVGWRALNPLLDLPADEALRAGWEALCDAHPEGIPPSGPGFNQSQILLQPPARTATPPSLSPEQQAALDTVFQLRHCAVSAAIQEAFAVTTGLCLGGELDVPQGGWTP